MLPVGGMSTPQTPHPRTNSYNIYTPPNTALITNSAKPSSTSSENYTTLIPTQNDTNSGNQNIVPHSPHRRSIFMVHKHESPAHGKVNYHQGFHWRGKWWNRAQGSTGYGSDESQDEDGDEKTTFNPVTMGIYSRLEASDPDLDFMPPKVILSAEDLIQTMEDSVGDNMRKTLSDSQKKTHFSGKKSQRLQIALPQEKPQMSVPSFTIMPRKQRHRILGHAHGVFIERSDSKTGRGSDAVVFASHAQSGTHRAQGKVFEKWKNQYMQSAQASLLPSNSEYKTKSPGRKPSSYKEWRRDVDEMLQPWEQKETDALFGSKSRSTIGQQKPQPIFNSASKSSMSSPKPARNFSEWMASSIKEVATPPVSPQIDQTNGLIAYSNEGLSLKRETKSVMQRTQYHTPPPNVFGVRLRVPFEALPNAGLSSEGQLRTEAGVDVKKAHNRTSEEHLQHTQSNYRKHQIRIVHEAGTMTDPIKTRTISVSTRTT